MNNTPTHIVYHVKDIENTSDESRSIWTKIGAAWPHKDQKGFNITLDGLLPLDGRLVVREAMPADEERSVSESDVAPSDLPF